jgi:hypothetical protein
MYCFDCKIEFIGLRGKCPNCNIPLIDERPHEKRIEHRNFSYNELVDLCKTNSGVIRFDLATTVVETEKKWSFPYFGRGYGWAKKIQGLLEDISVELDTTVVSKKRKLGFPYLGYGYAWEKVIEGTIGGNEAILNAVKFEIQRKWGFPYFGYGFAWTQVMNGDCGELLELELCTTEVSKKRIYGFPYRGYGLAWINQCTLSMTFKE